MLGLPSGAKIYFCSRPVDFRKGFDGLCGIVESCFEMNVWWEPGGLTLWYKRLERGTFEMPRAADDQAHVTLDATQLAMLIGGVPLAAARTRRKRLDAA